MSTKIEKAERNSDLVQNCWGLAHAALSGTVRKNGYGIFIDESHLRQKLEDAKKHIEEALKVLNQIEFPTRADYEADEKSNCE